MVEYTPKNGYDLRIYGLENGQFLSIHIPALFCIFCGLISAIVVIVASFKHQNVSTFFNWTKSERFAVYIAICDGLFNICHSMDHLHIAITKNHVYPKDLCRFYAFMLAEFVTAQNLMVNVVSVNAFVLIYFRRNINFGRCDWRLLAWMFGFPFGAAIIALSLGTLGPNGTFCYFDGVKGNVANLFFTTIPLVIIILMNTTLYILTWYRIRVEEPKFSKTSGRQSKIVRGSHRAAKNMSLFVAAFLFQWWAMAMYGVWQFIDNDVPLLLFQFVTTFSNIGGVLNGIVYFIIRRRKSIHKEESSTSTSESGRANHNCGYKTESPESSMACVESTKF